MIFIEDGQVWESFVYVPKKPIAHCSEDGTFDTSVVNELVVKAKAGDNEAQMLLFEQYQYLWKSMFGTFVEDMSTKDDAIQDAFVVMMDTLAELEESNAATFTVYYAKKLKSCVCKAGIEKDRRSMITFSIDEQDEYGNLIHDLPDKLQRDFEDLDGLDNVKKLLTEFEFEVCILFYVWDIPLREIAKHYGYTYKYVRNISYGIRNKLKVLL